MSEIKFVPKQCEGENATFEGFVSLKVPNFDEKYGILEHLNLEADESGDMRISTAQSEISTIRKTVALAKPFFLAVELKHKASGKEFKSFDDLSADSRGHSILMQAALSVVNGSNVGNG